MAGDFFPVAFWFKNIYLLSIYYEKGTEKSLDTEENKIVTNLKRKKYTKIEDHN